MEVVLSQMRWPAEVYRSLKAKAKEKEVSINALVVEAVKRMLSVDEKSPSNANMPKDEGFPETVLTEECRANPEQ